MSGSTPQPLSPLCLRQGLSLAWSTHDLASESCGFTCSNPPPLLLPVLKVLDTTLNFLEVGSGG